MTYESLFWIILFIILVIVEAATLALVTIWFAIGALLSSFFALFGAPIWMQIAIFILVSLACLILLFPIARKHLNVGKARTNVDSLIGKKVVVTEPISFNHYGKVSINGVIWLASSEEAFEKDDLVIIIRIEGTKVIVSSSQP